MKLIECPRDAMQGFKPQIPTETKINYLNNLLSIGFDTIDFGSFVSPKAIPQMADTKEVLAGLNLNHTKSKLLAIVANLKGAEMASEFKQINYLGYPFSISETFQQRNTNKSISDSQKLVKSIISILEEQELVVYISMGFGNPYGDKWSVDLIEKYVDFMINNGVKTISLADTLGMANTKDITTIFDRLSDKYEGIEFGAHFHSTPTNWKDKNQAAYDSGCLRFDTAMKGYGGCPFADDHLVGNTATENLIEWMESKGIKHSLRLDKLDDILKDTVSIFSQA
jgi:hydroxymethylglutaryl-CoA lyase